VRLSLDPTQITHTAPWRAATGDEWSSTVVFHS
jgi:hypothetical protein